MLTEIETETKLPPELASITETVEYPPEVVDRWLKEAEITMLRYKAGEDLSIESLAAKLGFNLDDLDYTDDLDDYES